MASKLVGRFASRRIGAQLTSFWNPIYSQNPGMRIGSEQPHPRFNFHSYLLEEKRREAIPFLPLSLSSFRGYRTMPEAEAAAAEKTLQKKAQATLMYLIALVFAMVGCSYAAVPLYRKFCQATGYGGTVRRIETVEEKIARHSDTADAMATRQLVVQFNADIADGLPWKFTPTQRAVKVKPGQSTLAFFTAENLSSKPITGVSTYNVTPMKAGAYFNKIQCFCFEEQRLLPGEKIDMPVCGKNPTNCRLVHFVLKGFHVVSFKRVLCVNYDNEMPVHMQVFFYIDPEFVSDPKMNDVNNLILSYTFFKVEEDNEEEVVSQDRS